MKTKGFVYVLILLVGLFTSCEHKDLYLLGDREMRVNVDWSLFDKEPVTGMTMYIYPDSSDVFKVETQNIDCAVLDLMADNYRFMVYNQSVSEFQTLEFVDMEDFERAYVRGATATSKWYSVKSEDVLLRLLRSHFSLIHYTVKWRLPLFLQKQPQSWHHSLR